METKNVLNVLACRNGTLLSYDFETLSFGEYVNDQPGRLRLSADLESEFRRLASESGTSFSELVEEALRDFMRRHAPATGATSPLDTQRASTGADGWGCGERRACCRHEVSVPAVVHTEEQDGRTGRYRVAEVRNISASGIGLRFENLNHDQMSVGRKFEVLFQLSENRDPQRMTCTACRRDLDSDAVYVGAAFSEPFNGMGPDASVLA
jgi:hypothetical protein